MGRTKTTKRSQNERIVVVPPIEIKPPVRINVVESWNSTNGFIFYDKGAEPATNKRENQEMGLLCLHLLQASLVYINTLMIQLILREPEWLERMTIRDLAALSPLLTQHINQYGRFELDLATRIPLEEAA